MLLVLALWPLFCGAPCRFQEHALCWHWSRRTAVPVRCPYFRDWCNGLGRQRYYKPFYVSSPSIAMCCVLHLLCLSTMWSAVLLSPLPFPYCAVPTLQSKAAIPLIPSSSSECKALGTNLRCHLEFPLLRMHFTGEQRRETSVRKTEVSNLIWPGQKKKITRNLCVSTIFLSIYLSVVYHLSTIYQSSVFTEFRGDKAIM